MDPLWIILDVLLGLAGLLILFGAVARIPRSPSLRPFSKKKEQDDGSQDNP